MGFGGDHCDEHDLPHDTCFYCEEERYLMLEKENDKLQRNMCIAKHLALLSAYNVGCQPNDDKNPTGMLYYIMRDGGLSTYLFSINSYDPLHITDELEGKLKELYPDVKFKLALAP